MSNSILNTIPHVVQGWQTLIEHWNRPTPLFNKYRHHCFKYVQQIATASIMAVCGIATPLLAAVDYIYTHANRKFSATAKDGDCRNLFSSNLIIDYKNILKTHLQNSLEAFPNIKNSLQSYNKSPLEIALAAFINIVEKDESSIEGVSNRKAWFKDMTNAFRTLCSIVQNSDEEMRFEVGQWLEMVSYKRYLELDLLDSLKTLHKAYSKDLSLNSLPNCHARMLEDKSLRCNGAVLDLFDAHAFGNIPFALPLIKLQKDQTINMIRMPSVTKDVNKTSFIQATKEVAIIEEFQWFLRSLSSQNKSHFYVNLMDRNHGNEAVRSRAIEHLDGDDSNPIHVLSLDKDSDFYKQNGQFSSEILNADHFKGVFKKNILATNGNYYLPKGTSEELVHGLIEGVHKDFFNSNSDLKKIDRKNFIELVYCRLIEALALQYHVSSMNISCKHCIDRGANQNFIFMNYMRTQNKVLISDDELMTLLFSPAIMVANRPIRQHYMSRAHQAYQLLKGKCI